MIGVRDDLQLSSEHEALQLRGQFTGLAVRHHQQQVIVRLLEQRKQRNDAALGGQPGIPLPMPGCQCAHVVGELRLRKSRGIRALKHDEGMVGQGKEGSHGRGKVVRHEGED